MSETATATDAVTDAPAATTAGATTAEVANTDTSKAADTAVKTDDGDSLIGKKTETEAKVEAVEKQIPEKYEFQLPEGMKMDTELLEKATPLLKELKLDQTEANKLFGLIVQREQANVDRWNKTVGEWKQTTLKELGENPETELAYTSKFIDKFGGKRADAVRTILNDSGLGSHPDIVHLFREAGKFFSSDSLATGINKNIPNDPESKARKMFPNTKFD